MSSVGPEFPVVEALTTHVIKKDEKWGYNKKEGRFFVITKEVNPKTLKECDHSLRGVSKRLSKLIETFPISEADVSAVLSFIANIDILNEKIKKFNKTKSMLEFPIDPIDTDLLRKRFSPETLPNQRLTSQQKHYILDVLSNNTSLLVEMEAKEGIFSKMAKNIMSKQVIFFYNSTTIMNLTDVEKEGLLKVNETLCNRLRVQGASRPMMMVPDKGLKPLTHYVAEKTDLIPLIPQTLPVLIASVTKNRISSTDLDALEKITLYMKSSHQQENSYVRSTRLFITGEEIQHRLIDNIGHLINTHLNAYRALIAEHVDVKDLQDIIMEYLPPTGINFLIVALAHQFSLPTSQYPLAITINKLEKKLRQVDLDLIYRELFTIKTTYRADLLNSILYQPLLIKAIRLFLCRFIEAYEANQAQITSKEKTQLDYLKSVIGVDQDKY